MTGEQKYQETDEREFTEDEVVRIVIEAGSLQELDHRLRDPATLDSITEQQHIKDTDVLYADAAYAAARELGIGEEYVRRVLKRTYPSSESQLKELEELNSSPSPIVSERLRELQMETRAMDVSESCERELEAALLNSSAFDKIYIRRKQGFEKDYLLLVGLSSFKEEKARFSVVSEVYRIDSGGGLLSRLFKRDRKLLAILSFHSRKSFSPSEIRFQHDLRLYDHMFTSVCKDTIEEFKDQLGISVTHHYDSRLN